MHRSDVTRGGPLCFTRRFVPTRSRPSDGDPLVTSARHRNLAETAPRPRPLRLVLPATVATLVTGAVVAVAVPTGGRQEAEVVDVTAAPVALHLDGGDSPFRADRAQSFSRSAERVTLREKPKVTERQFMTAPLNLWPAPKEKGRPLDVLPKGDKVALTGVRKASFAQILHGGQIRWVKGAYLADEMPKPPKAAPAASTSGSSGSTGSSGSSRSTGSSGSSTGSSSDGGSSQVSAGGLSSAPCADGSGTESGITSSAVRLYRAACAAFPALSSYGGYDAHGEHASGRAIDFMVTDPGLCQALADWVRAHAAQLGVFDVIWAQRIWTPARAAEGWRSMPDRGSSTANHFDHVHVSVS
jgi:uncharacterized membrane protein YgcG